MNPFSLTTDYDEYLSELLAKVNKASSITLNEALKDLLRYLPECNVHSDYVIILKTITPHIGSSAKLTVNKIVYFLTKKLGSKVLAPIQTRWLYENIESEDEYAKRIIKDHVDVSNMADEFEGFLKWEDSIKDLVCFKFLVERSTKEHYFDISKLNLQTYMEFDLILDILKTIKQKNPLIVLKIIHGQEMDESSKYCRLLKEILERIKTITNTIFITRKYKILIEIYDCVDDQIYTESMYLEPQVFETILSRSVKIEDLCVQTIDQLTVILPAIQDRDAFIMRNLCDSMCLFSLCEKFREVHGLIVKHKDRFRCVANNTIKRHFIARSCPDHTIRQSKLDENQQELVNGIVDVFTGKYAIIIHALLEKSLNPEDFTITEIDEAMEYSVHVFPRQFFLTQTFTSSATHFIKKYPNLISEMIKEGRVDDIVSRFTGTKPEHITRHIDNVDDLRDFLATVPRQEIKRLCFLNSNPVFKIAFLFYLRDEIEQFPVEYSIVFESFFNGDFLKYLVGKNNNIPGFVENCIKYLRAIPFKNCALFCGGNFDSEDDFYYNFGLPERDPGVKMLYSVLSGLRIDVKLEFLLHVFEVLLFLPVNFSEKLKKHLKSSNDFESLFDLKDKNFIVRKLIPRNVTESRIDLQLLKRNRNKAIDVILRNILLEKAYLHDLKPGFLSHKALENVVKQITSTNTTPFKILKTNAIVIPSDRDISQQLDLMHINDSGERNCEILINEFFKKGKAGSILDFLYLLESDDILLLKDFRSERLAVYEPFLDAVSTTLSEIFLNMYSISKLENGDENEVFEMVVEPLSSLKKTFWVVLSRVLMKINNMYVSFFIEKILMRYLSDSTGGFLEKKRY